MESRTLERIDLRWHDLRHEGACRLLADGVDIRIIRLMLGHASIQQTQRYLNVTDEELRRGLEVSWTTKADRFALRREADRPCFVAGLSPFVPGNIKIWLRGTQPTLSAALATCGVSQEMRFPSVLDRQLRHISL